MPADIYLQLAFFAVAAIGGAINSVAGGGSFLLFPVLMFSGLSPVVANIMCTIALWPGSVASSYAYWREVKTPIATLRKLMFFCVIGSVIGTWALLYFPEAVFASLVPWLLLVATLIFTFGRHVVAQLRLEHASTNQVTIYISMLLIAIYGGYFGAGIGILMLAMLQLAGYSHMHEMNAMKTVLGSAINGVAVIVFIASGNVAWHWAPALIAGGIFGGYVGTKLALQTHPEKIRRCVVLIAFVMTAYFFLRTT